MLILDDVITAGTAIDESAAIIHRAGAELAGIVVAMDRQEVADDGKTALETMAVKHEVSVHSISNLGHVIEYLDELGEDDAMLDRVKVHQAAFCRRE